MAEKRKPPPRRIVVKSGDLVPVAVDLQALTDCDIKLYRARSSRYD